MILLAGFAFVAGIVTIASPCILPILPIVLSGSIGGKRKPLGVIAGFVVSFTFFTLFLAGIIKALDVSAEAIRVVAVVIVFTAGLTFLIPQLQARFEVLFSKLAGLGQRRAAGVPHPAGQVGDGNFMSGFLIGLSLGLVWTPCVGPILASVISLSLAGDVGYGAAVITLFYALGTALPMLAVMYGGRALLHKIPGLLSNLGTIQKVFGALLIAVALMLAFGIDKKFQTFVLETFPNYGENLTRFENNEKVMKALDETRK